MRNNLIYILLVTAACSTIAAAVVTKSEERRFMALNTFGSTILATALTLINPNKLSQNNNNDIK